MDQMSYRGPEEYPLPERLTKNAYYARVLLPAYSGQVSELTAVNQYFFHHLVAGETNPQISAGLLGIAMVEIQHLDLLGTCIRQLGVQPRYHYFRGSRSQYWSTGFVSYGNTLGKMLQADIQGEYDAIEQYKYAVRSIREPHIQRLIRRIIDDEMLHIEILQSYLLTL